MMGCIGSHLSGLMASSDGFGGGRDSHLTSRRCSVFPVLNVDELGRHISPGKLEVTEGDLVLHINGRPSLIWPLRSLRRYGYENDLFSFEAGRRCPTGPGIYAFKCSRAQAIFELLQAKIQGNPGAAPIIPHNPRMPPTSSASAHANLSPLSLSPTFDYVNIIESDEVKNNNGETQEITSEGDHPLYVNVNSQSTPPYYANLNRQHPQSPNGNLKELRNGLSSIPAQYSNFKPEVNYAELDLEAQNSVPISPTGMESPVVSSSSRIVSRTTSLSSRTLAASTAATGNTTGNELGYATIDFDRTACLNALSVVTRSKIKLDYSGSLGSESRNEETEEVSTVIRKTRHNSTVL